MPDFGAVRGCRGSRRGDGSCGRVLAHFGSELAFAFSIWKFKDFGKSGIGPLGGESRGARGCHIIFPAGSRSEPGDHELAGDMCAGQNEDGRSLGRDGHEPHEMDMVVAALLSRLQFAAQRLRMDFLPLLPPARGREIRNPGRSALAWLNATGGTRQQSLGIERVSGTLSPPAQSGCGLARGIYHDLTSVARLRFSPLSHIRRSMLVVHVHIHVKPECVEVFKQATLANARESLKEPGVARFDVVQQQDDPARFVLVEVYRDAAPQRRTRRQNIIRSGGTRSRQ